MLTSSTEDPRLAGRVAFTYPSFVSYTLARFFIVVALEMQSVAVAWQVYEITKRPLDLGYVGLAQFLPGFVLFLSRGTRRLFLRPPQAADVVLWRLRPVLGAFARNHLARVAIGSCNLLRVSAARDRPLFQLAGEPRAAAAVGSRRTFLKRGRLDCQYVPDRKHRRPGFRRNLLRTLSRPGKRLYDCRGGIHPLHHSHHADPSAARIARTRIARKRTRRKRTGKPAYRACRVSVPLGEEADPRLDLARYVRRPARRSGSGAAALRPNNPAHRSLGTRPAALRARCGRRADGDRGRSSPHPPPRRDDHAVVRSRVRRADHRVRNLAQPYPLPRSALPSRPRRHRHRR